MKTYDPKNPNRDLTNIITGNPIKDYRGITLTADTGTAAKHLKKLSAKSMREALENILLRGRQPAVAIIQAHYRADGERRLKELNKNLPLEDLI